MLETIVNGGVMMLPLILLSFIAWAVVLDRAWAFYRHGKIDHNALRTDVRESLADGDVEEAEELCAETPGPVSAVLLAGLHAYRKLDPAKRTPETIQVVVGNAMEDHTERALSAISKRFYVLATVGNVAPLLGMTGTVTGMIVSFKALAGAAGLDSALVGAGIAEALITTAAGLIIAIAAVVPYNFFRSLADKIELEVDEAAAELLDYLKTAPGGPEPSHAHAA
ncbi:MAG: MotA/TolQ/ExbB proton channel family protein [Planctomycetota bacterium]|nr:MotA/TolQ/ExbB proton channel family protein [Planctomycetota bacterium]